MTESAFPIDRIASSVLGLAGRTPDDPELQRFLTALKAWPLDPFPSDEYSVYHIDKKRGFCLMFEDATLVKHPAAQGKKPRTPLLIGCYFYTQGKDDYEQFAGTLPYDVAWTDTPESLTARLGPPKNVIVSKKTGALTAHRWAMDALLLTVGYRKGAIEDLYVGIV
jgi:hypothetical protein